MIVDSSAVIAIFLEEAEKEEFTEAILRAERPMISAGNHVEICLRVDPALNPIARQAFDEFFDALGLEIVPVTASQAQNARKAGQLYGRGSGHNAKLNYGDCLAYALAKELDQPLLFKGNHFIHTDLKLWKES